MLSYWVTALWSRLYFAITFSSNQFFYSKMRRTCITQQLVLPTQFKMSSQSRYQPIYFCCSARMSVDLDSTVTSMVLMSTPLSSDMDPDAKREWRRAKVTREILDTERTYQNHLELVATVSYLFFVVFNARKRSCGRLMFLHLSVILFTGGGGSVQLSLSGRPPAYGKEQSVRILLECILDMSPFCMATDTRF